MEPIIRLFLGLLMAWRTQRAIWEGLPRHGMAASGSSKSRNKSFSRRAMERWSNRASAGCSVWLWVEKQSIFVKTFEELNPSDCKWATGDCALPGERSGSAYLFCAEQRVGNGPYCAKHTAMAIGPKV
jgi:hypothetical protein